MAGFKVVVIDSLASLFLPILGDSFNDGNLTTSFVNRTDKTVSVQLIFNQVLALLNKAASDIKRLAVTNRCLVLIINHASNCAAQMPFLGRYWLHVPNVRLDYKRSSSDEFQLTVIRNVYNPVEGKCTFRLESAS